MRDAKAEEDPDRRETFSSDIIDLSGIDLNALPSSVLRAAVQRVCAELAGDGETSAAFQSSLRGGLSPDDEGPAGQENLESADDNGIP